MRNRNINWFGLMGKNRTVQSKRKQRKRQKQRQRRRNSLGKDIPLPGDVQIIRSVQDSSSPAAPAPTLVPATALAPTPALAPAPTLTPAPAPTLAPVTPAPAVANQNYCQDDVGQDMSRSIFDDQLQYQELIDMQDLEMIQEINNYPIHKQCEAYRSLFRQRTKCLHYFREKDDEHQFEINKINDNHQFEIDSMADRQQLEIEKLSEEYRRRIRSVRMFWRDRIYRGHTRGGRILKTALTKVMNTEKMNL